MQTQQLIHSLANRGIDTFFIAPGSRNYELIEAINSISGIRTHVHYDERGLAYFALGYALATKKIAALAVTSGTAVGLLLPAVMEAYHSGVTLLLLTADRPASLLGTGANQTCDQRGIYSNFTRLAINLDLTSPHLFDPEEISEKVIASSIDSPGPIHLNCHLKAPSSMQFPVLTIEEHQKPHRELPTYPESMIRSFLNDPEALLLIGRNYPLHDRTIFKNLQISTSCTVVTDLLSNCRGLFSKEIPLAEFTQERRSIQRVLHLGGSFIDTNILSFLEKQTLLEYVQISPPSHFFDPYRKTTGHVPFCPWELLKKLATTNKTTPSPAKSYNPNSLSQAQFLKSLLLQKEEDMSFFVSNSTLIRDFDQFYYPSEIGFQFYSNRGLSGSDGTLATFAGLCLGLKKKCIGFSGDIAFLHDISSLSLLNQLKYGAELFLFNNGGGDIFRRLNHSKNSPLLESHYATAHDYQLSELVRGYGFDCKPIHTLEALDEWRDSSPTQIWEVILEQDHSSQKRLCPI